MTDKVSAFGAISKALADLDAQQAAVEEAKSENDKTSSRLNSCECARSNAVIQLAKAISALPDPILSALMNELDSMPKVVRFKVKERNHA